MPRFILLLIISVFLSNSSFAQKKVIKPAKAPVKPVAKYPMKTKLAIGVGFTRSVLYLARNVKPNNDANGFNGSLVYGGARMMRVSLEYTHYRRLNIAPTWYNIKASTAEMNLHFLARFRNKRALFYPLVGLSYNVFSGTFTGIDDYLNLSSLYDKDQYVRTRWVGLNLGTGYEYHFRPVCIFLDYKMRVGITEGYNQLNIQDVCISAGLRFNLKVPSVYALFIYRDTRSRYLLDKADGDDDY